MLLYFLRHAEAEDVRQNDFERRLTSKGLEQADKAGRFCARYGLVPRLILSSPVTRAHQTAEIVARKLGDLEVLVQPWIACGMTPDVFLQEIAGFQRFESIMIVGHEPDFSQTLAVLLGVQKSEALKIRKSSLTAVTVDRWQPASAELQFSVPVRLM